MRGKSLKSVTQTASRPSVVTLPSSQGNRTLNFKMGTGPPITSISSLSLLVLRHSQVTMMYPVAASVICLKRCQLGAFGPTSSTLPALHPEHACDKIMRIRSCLKVGTAVNGEFRARRTEMQYQPWTVLTRLLGPRETDFLFQPLILWVSTSHG